MVMILILTKLVTLIDQPKDQLPLLELNESH